MKVSGVRAGFIVLLALVVVVILVAFVHITPLSDSDSGSAYSTIEPGQYSSYSTEMNPGDDYRITILSASAPVDVIVLDARGYDGYLSTLNGSPKLWAPYLAVRNVTAGEVVFNPEEADLYYLVIDNSPLVEGGANGASTVHVNSSTSYHGNEHYLISFAGIPLTYW